MKEHEVFEMRMWKGSLNRYTTTNKRGIHMDSTWINAPAKINLGLDVIRRRDDGYHEVKMIMQSIRLFDRLTLKKTKTPDISLTTNLHFLPVNEDNLVYKSAKMLMEEFGISEGVSITLVARALLTSIDLISAWACVLCRILPCSMPGRCMSATYVALPVTLS